MASKKQEIGTFSWKPMSVKRCIEANDPKSVYYDLKLSMINSNSTHTQNTKKKRSFNNRRNHKRNKHKFKQHLKKNKQKVNPTAYNFKLSKLLHPILYSTIFDSNIWLKSFQLKKEPNTGDWLLTDDGLHDQNGQTFDEWYQNVKNSSPTHFQNKIGLIPISNFNIKLKINQQFKNDHMHDDDNHYITLHEILSQLIEIYFGLKVKSLYPINIKKIEQKTNNFTQCLQLSSNQILKKLNKEKKSELDLFCLVGMSMIDLYPNDEWMNFVFGSASNGSKTGVFSFARYLPGFYDENRCERLNSLLNGKFLDENDEMKKILSSKDESLFIRRCGKVLTHEIGHIFGIEHCIHFECVMNGANHIGEVDESPLYLCPICLNKIYFARITNDENRTTFNKINEMKEFKIEDVNDKEYKFKLPTFDVLNRYYMMKNWCNKYQLIAEYEWYKQRIELIENTLKKTQSDATKT